MRWFPVWQRERSGLVRAGVWCSGAREEAAFVLSSDKVDVRDYGGWAWVSSSFEG